jgi:8-oxo-dGTP diphosphatase
VKRTQNISLTVDAVVFGYSRNLGLTVLLIRRKNEPYSGSWALPGGFVENDESLSDAMERELKEETGLKVSYSEQLHAFGEPNRDPRKRIVSIAFLGIVRQNQFNKVKAADDADEAEWFRIKHLPKLAFDHGRIVKMAFKKLQEKLKQEPIAFELLDKRFPFSDLENLYSTLLEKPIDRRNFRKKVASLAVLEELKEKAPSLGAGRPGNLFQFNKSAFKELIQAGGVFEI